MNQLKKKDEQELLKEKAEIQRKCRVRSIERYNYNNTITDYSINPSFNRINTSKSPINKNYNDSPTNKKLLKNSKSSSRILENSFANKTFTQNINKINENGKNQIESQNHFNEEKSDYSKGNRDISNIKEDKNIKEKDLLPKKKNKRTNSCSFNDSSNLIKKNMINKDLNTISADNNISCNNKPNINQNSGYSDNEKILRQRSKNLINKDTTKNSKIENKIPSQNNNNQSNVNDDKPTNIRIHDKLYNDLKTLKKSIQDKENENSIINNQILSKTTDKFYNPQHNKSAITNMDKACEYSINNKILNSTISFNKIGKQYSDKSPKNKKESENYKNKQKILERNESIKKLDYNKINNNNLYIQNPDKSEKNTIESNKGKTNNISKLSSDNSKIKENYEKDKILSKEELNNIYICKNAEKNIYKREMDKNKLEDLKEMKKVIFYIN